MGKATSTGKRVVVRKSGSFSQRRRSAKLKRHHYLITVRPFDARQIALYRDGQSQYSYGRFYRCTLHRSLRKITPPTGEVTLFVKEFARRTRYDEVLDWADAHGYRVVFPWERELFSFTFPELQKKFRIADLGLSTEYPNDGLYGPVLGRSGGDCSMVGNWCDDAYSNTGCRRFLFALM